MHFIIGMLCPKWSSRITRNSSKFWYSSYNFLPKSARMQHSKKVADALTISREKEKFLIVHFLLILKELVEQHCNVSIVFVSAILGVLRQTCYICTNTNEKPAETYYQSLKSGKISFWINHFVSITDCFYLFRTIPLQT